MKKLNYALGLLAMIGIMGACKNESAQNADAKKDSVITTTVAPKDSTVTQSKESQDAITMQAVVEQLKAGNKRFTEGKTLNRNFAEQVKITSQGQYPYALVLNCMDSRTSAIQIFDQGIGDIFELRIAGNFVDNDVIGSMEYATEHAHAKVIVVMGHTHCGAVKGAADNVKEGLLGKMLTTELTDAVKACKNVEGEHNSKNEAYVKAIVVENVKLGMKEITTKSKVIKHLVEEGKLLIVGAVYNIETGTVEFLN